METVQIGMRFLAYLMNYQILTFNKLIEFTTRTRIKINNRWKIQKIDDDTRLNDNGMIKILSADHIFEEDFPMTYNGE